MNRIDSFWHKSDKQKPVALITFISAGDPSLTVTEQLIEQLPKWGADVIEIGIPFSDPTADGPIIQKAYQRALTKGFSLSALFSLLRRCRQRNDTTPFILMGYVNPLLAFGLDRFFQTAQEHGVDGVILVDVPYEESTSFHAAAQRHGVHLIRLIAPNTSSARLSLIVAKARGFLYYVSIAGVTGTKTPQGDEIAMRLQEIKQQCALPVAVGFGIKDGNDARDAGRYADGVVVGSALVQLMETYHHHPDKMFAALETKVQELKTHLGD